MDIQGKLDQLTEGMQALQAQHAQAVQAVKAMEAAILKQQGAIELLEQLLEHEEPDE